MAKFEVMSEGAEGLSMDLKKLGRLTDEDAYTILEPAADVVKAKFADKIKAVFQQHTGKLAASIQEFKKKADGPFILVYPHGPHHRYKSRKKGSKTASAGEVAFVLEYGAPARNIAATHWMENSIQESDQEITEAMQAGFDTLCDEKGIGR